MEETTPVLADRPPKILIVCDNDLLASLYARWLDDEFDVSTASDGAEALRLADGSFGLVLLDRRLPGGPGETVLEGLRERGVDFVVATVSAVEPDVEIAAVPGDDSLTKSIDREQLERTVEELLLRADRDPTKQHLLAFVSRRVALERELGRKELLQNEEYRSLQREIAAMEAELDVDPQAISSVHRPPACPTCDLRWDVDVDGIVGFLPIASEVWKCRSCGEIAWLSYAAHQGVARK